MASDGSVRAPNGSFAWVIYGIASKTHWSGHNTIAKGHSDLSSFCTEPCTYLGALYALRAILTAFPLPRNSPPIHTTIHIDNSGVVSKSSNTPFSIQQCLLPDWDIFNEASQVCLTIPGTIKVQHIKSHQDRDTNPPKTLPLPARLNILADSETHKAYTTYPIFHQAPFLPSTPVALVLNGLHITSNQRPSASMAYYTPIMSAHFKEKHHWSEDTFLSIDWPSSDKEYKRLSPGRRLEAFKLQNGLWPTQYVLHQRKPAQSPACPRCHLSPETHDHVLCCPQAQASRLQQWRSVETVFKSTLHTPSLIYDAIEYGIRSWQEGDPNLQWPFPIPSNNDPIDQPIFLAYKRQSLIGWLHALRGHLCLHWGGCYVHFHEV
jgi:hypothetical protein